MPRPPKPYSPRVVAEYFRFYDKVLDFPQVSLTDACVFSILASLQRGRPTSNPSHSYIASRLKISQSTVIRSLHTLESTGLISITRLFSPDGRKQNIYTTNPQLAEDLKQSRHSLRKTQLKAIRQRVNEQLDNCQIDTSPPILSRPRDNCQNDS